MKSKGRCEKSCKRFFDAFAFTFLYFLTFSTALSPDVGFVPLRIKDYAADLFGPSNQLISALRLTDRQFGGDLNRLRQQYQNNLKGPSFRDWQGFNVSFEVLKVTPSMGAKTISFGSRGDGGAFPSQNLSVNLGYFTSVDIVVKVYWTIDSYYREPEGYNATEFNMNIYEKYLDANNISVGQNWHLAEQIYPEAAPVIARLPLESCRGFSVLIQVEGKDLAPFVVEKENLLMFAMFYPLNEKLWIHQAHIDNITQYIGEKDTITVAIALVAANSIEEVSEALVDTLPCSSCPKTVARQSFLQAFMGAGVNVTEAMLVSIADQPGLTLQDQAAAMGFPHLVDVRPIEDKGKPRSPLVAIIGSMIVFLFVAFTALGVFFLIRKKHAKRACHSSIDPKSHRGGSAHGGFKNCAGSMMHSSARSMMSSACPEFDMHKWSLPTIRAEDIEICRYPDGKPVELGRGGFCKVLKGLHGGVREVALKMLLEVEDPEKELARFTQELDLLRSLSFDSNIVQLYGAAVMEGCPVLILECMEGGDLCNAISNDRSGELGWYNKGHKIALDVVRGLCFLHSCKCLHGDLTSRNILLNRDYTAAKVGDLGLAKMLQSSITDMNVGGTLAFAAPELLLNMRCNEKADIFSLGVVLWNICTQEVPLRGHLRRLQVPEECPASIAELIDDCLERPPEDRPSAREAFEVIKKSMSPALCKAACCQKRPPHPPQPLREGSMDGREGSARQPNESPQDHYCALSQRPTEVPPERCCPLSQRWRSVTGCSLSRLAPRDLSHALPSPPNPFSS
ncbi:probable mitogen-activated protein kinase kinase kinase 20 at C-terminar half [Coccomyxa sp. Obi]|nr:probable mitogen-activated protein kinase kinase kinase 20 at C-terminar half [Coccomyxa sp. Obi]